MTQPVISISSYPSELLVHIFSFADISTLAKVACVCKGWNEIVESLKWKEIHMRTFLISIEWIGPIPASWKQYCLTVHRVCEAFWKKNEKTPAHFVTLGTRLYKGKLANEAIGLFQQKNLFQSDSEAFIARCCSLANIFLKLKRYKESHEVLSQPPLQKGKILRIQGDVFLDQKDYQKAKSAYEQSLQLEQSLEAQLGLLTIFNEKGPVAQYRELKHRMDGAILKSTSLMCAKYCFVISSPLCFNYAKTAFENEPQKDAAAYLMAMHSEGENAKRFYELSIEHNPFNLKFLLEYVHFSEHEIYIKLIKNPNNQSCVQDLRELRGTCLAKAILLNPHHGETWFLQGKHHYEFGKGKEAVDAFRKAFDLGFKLSHFQSLLVKALLLDKQFEKAETCCREALKKNACPDFVLLLCKSLVQQRPLTTLKCLEIQGYADQYPNSIESLLLQAQVAEYQQRYQEAEEKYRKALARKKESSIFIEMDPHKERQDFETIHFGIARCLSAQDKVAESQKYVLEVTDELLNSNYISFPF